MTEKPQLACFKSNQSPFVAGSVQITVKLYIDTVQFSSKMNSMNAKRTIEKDIQKFISRKITGTNILFIWGPRRSGKTTLLNKFAKQYKARVFNFDFQTDREQFIPRENELKKLAGNNKIIFIDEVQNYPEGTVPIKILNDVYKIKVIAAGSSELRQKTGKEFDSLAGRYDEICCLPLSINEIQTVNEVDIEGLQIFGAYPEIHLSNQSNSQKVKQLKKMIDSYILKDIVDIYELKNSKLAKDVLKKIALQIGNEVSIRELSNSLNANIGTITSYIEIFIKNYILIPLPSFKTNLRKAVSENRKLYFYDLGIRNALVEDFRDLDLRPDKGGVWENFVVAEFEKRKKIYGLLENYYFYREYGGKEVDLVIEDYKKNYTCVEIKKRNGSLNKIFPLPHKSKIITQENFIEEFSN